MKIVCHLHWSRHCRKASFRDNRDAVEDGLCAVVEYGPCAAVGDVLCDVVVAGNHDVGESLLRVDRNCFFHPLCHLCPFLFRLSRFSPL